MTEDEFTAAILANPHTAALLRRLPGLGLPDCWVVAGCLFQTVWNLRSGRTPTADIRDYDVFYHDPGDLSWDAEDRVIRRVEAACADLAAAGAVVEVRNQARVALWYEAKYGRPWPPVAGSIDSIGRFLVAGTCVGVQPDGTGGITRVAAPFGLDDMAAGLLRPNPRNDDRPRFREKAESYRRRWPWLRVADMAD